MALFTLKTEVEAMRVGEDGEWLLQLPDGSEVRMDEEDFLAQARPKGRFAVAYLKRVLEPDAPEDPYATEEESAP